MLTETKRTDLFCEYYAKWITVYKKGAIRKVTMDKYLMTQKWLVKLVPNLRVCDMNRIAYQQLLNDMLSSTSAKPRWIFTTSSREQFLMLLMRA